MGGTVVMRMKTKLGQARGDGSAKHGLGHWKLQRITAMALVPLLIWFVISFIVMLPAPYIMVYDWMQSPFTVTMMILLAFSLFYHGFLGVQVIIEDYIHSEALKIMLIILSKFASVFMGLLSVMACLVIFLK